MRITVIYRPDSEHARAIETFVRDYQYQHPDEHVEVLNLDRRDGAATASLYDIVQYPAILALRNDGSLANLWQGDQLPLMGEVASYAYA